ncbi:MULTISPECIES: glycosyltransferase [Moorena]|uniref:Putative glycosyltransferase n=2 Tax=Moorena TaxID=1155738 RepID=F4XN49_9CYAN|nr:MULTISPECIES: glycosyltransferase [Moorena]NEQ17608.1 glycosyltransferase [Moorena sp. SIO3E2]EGJ34108.1 putative glycosyltransferase [Moorena producens 3L]NEP35291.1 glycosyltransferase [Moorena sp. SIO3B2]NEP65573.1 glycosyltransferase [Moorena sp. SIO3A5]NER85556.1 glycosyltransferase [Moorena sp. SIO3A2]
MSTVTIGFIPRERFSVAAECLQRIYDRTHIPFKLIVVDCQIPKVYRQQIENVLEGQRNVKFIHTDHHLLPNQCRNLAIREAKDDFLCLLENDVLVEDGWLSRLIEACDEYPADVAAPLVLERLGQFEKVHFDDRLDDIKPIQTSDGIKLKILPRSTPKEDDRNASDRRTMKFIETHCMLFRTEVFDRIGEFDESITAQEEVDVSLALYDKQVPIVFEPKAVVTFLPPPPIYPDEKEYYYLKWNPDTYRQDYLHVAKKCNLDNPPSAMGVVTARRKYASDDNPKNQYAQQIEYRTKVELTAKDIANLVSPGDPFILVHDQQLNLGDVAEGRQVIPFLEKDGQYWGTPPDDSTAISELERMKAGEANLIAFAWPSFWWLDYYTDFSRYLRSNYPCTLENERLVVFDLKT